MSGTPAPPPATEGAGGAHATGPHGRAGRNLPAALAVGLGLGAYVVSTLVFWRFGFVLLIALALALAAIELHNALRRIGMYPAVVPIVVGSVAIAIGSYLAGRQSPVVFSTTSVLLAALALTVVASLVWRMRGGAEGFVRDTAASLLIIGYVPLLGSFAALILAAPQDGVARRDARRSTAHRVRRRRTSSRRWAGARLSSDRRSASSASTSSVGSISRFLRSATMRMSMSQRSVSATKWSRRSPSTWTRRTMP